MLNPDPAERDPSVTRFATRTTTATRQTDGVGVEVTMIYLDDDPFAVHFVFDPLDRRIRWEFARELLIEPLARRPESFPRADVQVSRPNTADLVLTIDGDQSLAQPYRFDAEAVREFVAMTFRLVRPGQESDFVDWADAEAELDLPVGSLTTPPPSQ